jgi:hypothetical protein
MSPQATAPPQGISVEDQIERAKQLEADRYEIQQRIAKNREFLRLMAENDVLTDPQLDWLDDFYPQKEKDEKRSKDAIERTRKLKEEARGR